ncbi:Mitochondrial distribution and morphology protein 34-2 [Penicillium chermesinum]|uniref:Mitochondrial distribution and morphology protein 34 n=1 Tax=Penicillium chermesinum TaxID=63820 RepID=A0A9W9NBT1_9EURO|nr:Mitochondrial distribution and morphology protein 34-2 [Penicillium chermesinum]KAJ5216967.1 Mitochondrial distribution and morphology protein 34-2 [Penicillium chermesinum]
MAFNFNWSPLMADAGFYTRAQELLTAALNKSPKPPIIVDDIIVTELNLGSMPPDLEILEIGDLAEDRFRGIFKMSYSGDAFLTLKTRVQANPLNTYLITRPSFASPQPLAAATPLTIPLQITLSDFKLSGFVVLVFSKQKGITVVFRNDPLESLKVSSTFDSIPFVRDFLQKAIEAQLRILFMDELPAIIHRLSLRLWGPEGRTSDEEQTPTDNTEQHAGDGPGQDPLASPPQDPVDSLGNALNESEIASLSLDSSVETHSLFSQKNLLRLAALTDSQRTLSLFTPAISQVVYRAWMSPSDLNDFSASVVSPLSPALSRTHSHVGSLASSVNEGASTVSLSRHSLSGHSFSSYGLNLASGRHSKSHSRRRKKRVVDLRKPKTTDDAMSVSDDGSHTESSAPPSIYSAPLPVVNELADDPVTPPLSPETDSHLPSIPERHRASLSRPSLRRSSVMPREEQPYAFETIRASRQPDIDATPRPARHAFSDEKADAGPSRGPLPSTVLPFTQDESKDHVDPALVERLAGEIARRMRDEKLMASNPCSNFWTRPQDDAPPPAYGH